MNEKQTLSQRQATVQTLAPLQVQYVKMLEMNAAAIEDEVWRRVDENPALEVLDTDGHTDAQPDIADVTDNSDFDREDDRADAYARLSRNAGGQNRMPLESNATSESLSESLMRQLSELELGTQVRQFASYIIGNLDSNGRLTRTPLAIATDIAVHTGDDVDEATMDSALKAVQSLDPAGVGAIDLRECLLLQLERRAHGQQRDDAIAILTDNFSLFAAKNMDRLRSRSGIGEERLNRAIALIRSLDPKPGNSGMQDTGDRTLHITPDFTVEPDENNDSGRRFTVTLTQNIPELVVAESFRTDVALKPGEQRNAGANAFIQSRRQEAGEFITLIARRNATLLAVMKAIVSIQSEFFATEDPATIKPMILKDISLMTGKDMSVVSRSANGKYVSTPGGVYPLKMFFNERPHDDSEVSSHRILTELRAIIDAEDKRHPLSDDALTEMLRDKGLPVARRTVAKYREQLNIPNSRGRRSMTVQDS